MIKKFFICMSLFVCVPAVCSMENNEYKQRHARNRTDELKHLVIFPNNENSIFSYLVLPAVVGAGLTVLAMELKDLTVPQERITAQDILSFLFLSTVIGHCLNVMADELENLVAVRLKCRKSTSSWLLANTVVGVAYGISFSCYAAAKIMYQAKTK